MEWPPRSTEFIPLDFLPWDHVKALVYQEKIQDIYPIEKSIEKAITDITSAVQMPILQQVRTRIQVRFEKTMKTMWNSFAIKLLRISPS